MIPERQTQQAPREGASIRLGAHHLMQQASVMEYFDQHQ
jgi:hypothetical protein